MPSYVRRGRLDFKARLFILIFLSSEMDSLSLPSKRAIHKKAIIDCFMNLNCKTNGPLAFRMINQLPAITNADG
jgi:hypothetical protein